MQNISGTSLSCKIEFLLFLNFFNVFIYFWRREREHEWGRSRERGRPRIWSRLRALSYQHRAGCGAQTHKLWDPDPSRSRTLNWLSHPGAPALIFFKFIFLREREREGERKGEREKEQAREGQREGGRERIQSQKKSLSIVDPRCYISFRNTA